MISVDELYMLSPELRKKNNFAKSTVNGWKKPSLIAVEIDAKQNGLRVSLWEVSRSSMGSENSYNQE